MDRKLFLIFKNKKGIETGFDWNTDNYNTATKID